MMTIPNEMKMISDKNEIIFDNLCHRWDNNKCIQCSTKAYMNIDNRCIQSNPLCATFNHSNGNCLTCYSGFVIS